MSRRAHEPRVLLLLAIFAAVACAGHRAWTTADSWYRPRPTGDPVMAPAEIQVTVVPEAARGIAEAMLTNQPWVALSDAEAQGLSGAAVEHDPQTQLYLLRSVYLNESTGAFQVSQHGTQLEVHHGCLGRRAVPMKRAAVIVQLHEPPTE